MMIREHHTWIVCEDVERDMLAGNGPGIANQSQTWIASPRDQTISGPETSMAATAAMIK